MYALASLHYSALWQPRYCHYVGLAVWGGVLSIESGSLEPIINFVVHLELVMHLSNLSHASQKP